MADWPAGFWQRAPWDALHTIDVHALPRTPASLPLRLLGRRDTLIDAIRELSGLPDDTWPRRLCLASIIFAGQRQLFLPVSSWQIRAQRPCARVVVLWGLIAALRIPDTVPGYGASRWVEAGTPGIRCGDTEIRCQSMGGSGSGDTVGRYGDTVPVDGWKRIRESGPPLRTCSL